MPSSDPFVVNNNAVHEPGIRGGGRIRRVPPRVTTRVTSTQFSACLPAEANALGELRRRINDLLAGAGVAESDRYDTLLVAHELAANAIEHGSGAKDEIEVQCSLAGKELRLVVLDSSSGSSVPVAQKPRAEQARGRGLYLVDWLTDSWTETIVRGRRKITATLTLGRA
jgi:anti-sigma regulatory factor (Ser/Thr protein kinase)